MKTDKGGITKPVDQKQFNDMIVCHPKLVITCNNPHFSIFGEAEEKRTIFFHSNFCYVENPDVNNQFEKRIDTDLSKKLSETKSMEYMLNILINACSKVVCEPENRTVPLVRQKISKRMTLKLRTKSNQPSKEIRCDWKTFLAWAEEEETPAKDCPLTKFQTLRENCKAVQRDAMIEEFDKKAKD